MEEPTRRRPPWAWLFLISSSPWLFSSATLIPSPAVQRRTHRRPVLCIASAAEASAAPPTLQLSFDNEALRRLVVDPVPAGPPREVRGAHFVRVEPTPLDSPQLVAVSEDALALLGVDWDEAEDEPTAEAQRATFARCFSGNVVPAGAEPAAHCYCGHQFGTFAGQLGDGAAMYLGELVNGEGERWELQLKGAGLTPFSRTADGRKVLRSSIREFLCSEAMHHLGIPTTRAAGPLVRFRVRVRRVLGLGLPPGHPHYARRRFRAANPNPKPKPKPTPTSSPDHARSRSSRPSTAQMPRCGSRSAGESG